MKKFRKLLFKIIRPYSPAIKVCAVSHLCRVYDAVIITFVFISIVPLFFKHDAPFLVTLNYYVSIVFIVDYILNWITADFSLKKKKLSFLLYPITPWAIIDLLAIIPFFFNVSDTLVLFRIFRLVRLSRLFKALKYSNSFNIFLSALKKQKDILLALLAVTLAYIVISSLIIFNVEPDVFPDVTEAIFWSASALTNITVTDTILLTTTAGKVIALISSFLGIALIALPTGVITGAFMSELHRHHLSEKKRGREEEKSKSKKTDEE